MHHLFCSYNSWEFGNKMDKKVCILITYTCVVNILSRYIQVSSTLLSCEMCRHLSTFWFATFENYKLLLDVRMWDFRFMKIARCSEGKYHFICAGKTQSLMLKITACLGKHQLVLLHETFFPNLVCICLIHDLIQVCDLALLQRSTYILWQKKPCFCQEHLEIILEVLTTLTKSN